MPIPNTHASDEELLLAADGELSSRCAARIQAHVSVCGQCRERMMEIEAATAAFARAHRAMHGAQMPSIAGPRALLRARLAELSSKPNRPDRNVWRWLFCTATAVRTAALCVALVTAALAGAVLSRHAHSKAAADAGLASFAPGIVPDARLTPGATRAVALDEVCTMPHEEVIKEVPASVRQRVFAEYGIRNARADDYEIDYLIAPSLGGTDDIRNLWPEPYGSQWNAYVKDALEERLHQLVCARQLDLATAQRDIAADWIAAYRKYFHTGKPLYRHSGAQLISALASFDPIHSPRRED